jgi:hypothetical protein
MYTTVCIYERFHIIIRRPFWCLPRFEPALGFTDPNKPRFITETGAADPVCFPRTPFLRRTKRGGGKFFCPSFHVVKNFTKLENYYIFENLQIIKGLGSGDPGSWIQKTHPGSRGSKKHRIPDPDRNTVRNPDKTHCPHLVLSWR